MCWYSLPSLCWISPSCLFPRWLLCECWETGLSGEGRHGSQVSPRSSALYGSALSSSYCPEDHWGRAAPIHVALTCNCYWRLFSHSNNSQIPCLLGPSWLGRPSFLSRLRNLGLHNCWGWAAAPLKTPSEVFAMQPSAVELNISTVQLSIFHFSSYL